MENIFEHGGEHQYQIVQPILDVARKYSPEKHGEFERFYFDLLERALNLRSEREQVEDWVFDLEDYRKKSEVLIAVAILDSVTCLKRVAEKHPRGQPFFMGDFFEKLVAFGEKRGWSLPALQMQFTKTVGLPMINPLVEIISRQIYTTIDYN